MLTIWGLKTSVADYIFQNDHTTTSHAICSFEKWPIHLSLRDEEEVVYVLSPWVWVCLWLWRTWHYMISMVTHKGRWIVYLVLMGHLLLGPSRHAVGKPNSPGGSSTWKEPSLLVLNSKWTPGCGQYQLVCLVSEPFWKWILQLPLTPPSAVLL